MVLLRHLLGDALRRLRLRQGRTLREVSASARVSLGYLSEVERGQKEASSELLAAICSALDTPLSHVLRDVSDNLALAELQSEPVFADVMEPAVELQGAGRHGAADVRDRGPADEQGPAEHLAPAGRPEPVPAGPRSGGQPVAAGARSAVHLGAGHDDRLPVAAIGRLARGGQRIGAHASMLATGTAVLASSGLPGDPAGQSVFGQVARTSREMSSMIPV